MAFQRIRIKNTNVAGKVPGADKLDPAELCINLKDKIFSKDVAGNVFELGGAVEALNDIGDVNVDGVLDQQVLVYDSGSSNWVAANAASLAVDVDLDYTPASDKGTITNTAGDDAEIPLPMELTPAC